MPYVERDGGVIVAVYARPQPGRAEEALADNDAELVAFLTPAPAPIRKTLIIERMTDAEIDAARAARTSMPARDQETWDAATQIEPDDARIVGFFTTLFGATRAAELLAPEV